MIGQLFIRVRHHRIREARSERASFSRSSAESSKKGGMDGIPNSRHEREAVRRLSASRPTTVPAIRRPLDLYPRASSRRGPDRLTPRNLALVGVGGVSLRDAPPEFDIATHLAQYRNAAQL